VGRRPLSASTERAHTRPPAIEVERRVRHDEVGTEIAVLVVEQRVSELEVAGQAVDGEVPIRQVA
jgi:hypothetical protein